MTALPNALGAVPPGLDPIDYLNWLMQVEHYNRQQDAQLQNQGSDRQFDLLERLLKDAQRQQLNAQNANEGRYNDILGSINSGLSGVMGDLSGFGESQRSDINRQFDTRRNNLLTDLAERGMAGSTARIPIEAGTAESRQRALLDLDDRLRAGRSGARERFLDRTTGVMERRTDAYPNMSPVAAFAGQLGGMGAAPFPSLPTGQKAPRALPGLPQFAANDPRSSFVGGAMQPGRPTMGRLASTPTQQATGGPRYGVDFARGGPGTLGRNLPGTPLFRSPVGPAENMVGGSLLGPPMLRRPTPRPTAIRGGRQAQLPGTPQLGAGAVNASPGGAQRFPNMSDPANQRPDPNYLMTRNAYSASPGLGSAPKFLTPPSYRVPTANYAPTPSQYQEAFYPMQGLVGSGQSNRPRHSVGAPSAIPPAETGGGGLPSIARAAQQLSRSRQQNARNRAFQATANAFGFPYPDPFQAAQMATLSAFGLPNFMVG